MPAMFQGNARPDTDPSLSRDTLRPTAVPGPPACLARTPLRRELSDRTWCGVPCWWSATRWVDHVRLVYLRHYQVLRPRLCAGTGGGVSLEAVMAVAATHAGVADYRTGRSSRPLLGTRESATGLVVATGLGARTVSRVRTFLRLAGLATEVAGGRQRSLAERLESWRRDDRSRGWTADYALHPSRTHPVEAGVSLDGDRCCVGGTPPRSGSVPAATSASTGVSTARQRRTSPRNRTSRGLDAGALRLAVCWRQHPRAPSWVAAASPVAWSALLALPAQHGWTAADLNQLLRDHVTAGSVIPDRPRQPIGFVSWLLNRVDLAVRPTVHVDTTKARALALTQQRKHEQAERARDAPRRVAAARAALGGPGRAAVQSVLDDISRRRAAAERTAGSTNETNTK